MRAARVLGPDGIVRGAEPIELEGSGEKGVFLLHGFNDTPQSVRELATALHAAGWSVHAPLLARHGRTAEEFAEHASADEWIAQVQRDWAAHRARFPHAVLMGQSMGGALAVIAAASAPPSALVLLAPYLSMGWQPRWLSRIWPLWSLVVPRLRGDLTRSIKDPSARERSLGGEYFTPRTVAELRQVVDAAAGASAAVRVPTLFVHSRADYRIPSPSALRGFARLGSTDKTLVWRDDAGHVVAADRGREDVFATILSWLGARA
jgi:carboxylesterase